MGCLLACFGGEKGHKPRKRGRKSLRGDRSRAKESYQALITSPSKVVVVVANDDPIPELRERSQEQEKEESFGGGCRKKVTFDLNVKTYEDPAIIQEESSRCPLEEEAKEEENAGEEEEEESGGGGRAAASPVAFPTNHRYGNCTGSDGEEDVIDDTEDYEEDEEEEYSDFDDEEESYDSFFEKQRSCQEVSSSSSTVPDRATARRDRSRYVHAVLNPVQNLSQWKEAKVRRGFPPENPDKENIESRSEESKAIAFGGPEPTTFKVSDTAVDASLSTWLVTTPRRSNSSVNREDRPIIKQSSSPRRPPSKGPDDMPVPGGSVGGYWSSGGARSDTKGIPATTSRYRERGNVLTTSGTLILGVARQESELVVATK